MDSKRTKVAAAALALGALLNALPAWANETPASTRERREEARALMEEGRAARARNEHAKALTAFSAADAIMHVPPTLLEVARSQVALGQLLEAERTLGLLEVMPTQPGEPPPYRLARAAAHNLKGDLLLRTPVLTLEYSDPTLGRASRILVDGMPAELTPEGGLRINPGHHWVIAATGSHRAQVEVDTVEGESKPVFLDFRQQLKPSQSKRDDTSSSRHLSAATYALGGLAIAGLGTGATLAYVSRQQAARLEQECAPDCLPESVDQVNRLSTLSRISLGIGVAAAVGSVVAYLVSGKDEPVMVVARQPLGIRVGIDVRRNSRFATIDGAF